MNKLKGGEVGMKAKGDFIRVDHDGSWSKWKCRHCGREKHFIREEEPEGKCECRKVGEVMSGWIDAKS